MEANHLNNQNHLKVAVDSGPLTSGDSVRGKGVYARELLKALKMDGVDASKADLGKYDIVHFTSFNPFFISVPFNKPKNTKFILTIYDLIPLIYPAHYPPGFRGTLKWQINRLLIRKNIDAIITISETSKKDICRFIGIDPKKVFVAYLAARSVFKKITSTSLLYSIEVKYKLPKKFALYVGDVNYNKNIPNLIKACKLINMPLVIVGKQATDMEAQGVDNNTIIGPMDLLRQLLGKPHPELTHYKGLLSSFTNDRMIIRLGFVPDEDLAKIFNLADVFVQPSFYEGFGFGVLDAYACGTPVAAAKTQALVEVLGEEFSFFDPNSAEDIAKAMLNPNKNKKLPRIYSWKKTAEETLKIYGQVHG